MAPRLMPAIVQIHGFDVIGQMPEEDPVKK
jgi:hypothetical protein